jgi:hypothetical protein
MDPRRALDILTNLADGVDPITGEVLAKDHPCQHPDVVRALFVATAALQATLATAERVSALPDNAGKAWSAAEEQLLLQAFDAGTGEADLAKAHQRSRGSIRSRLVRLGRIER